ncbi:hypothetical protein MMC30_007952 [Trapelia coarctata]|nr:hypothetical protein [Trapelia coarctata]
MSKKVQIDQLGNAERLKQLSIIDKLREHGVGEDISLPQLVVVGDQSSGKSSLLEGLTELPFPVASQLCTRFATQVSFRRSAIAVEDSITVTVIPAPDSDDAYKQKLAGFMAVLKEFTQDEFRVIMDDATQLMGLPTTVAEALTAAKRFSRDVLKIEIVGRLYHNPTKEQTEGDLAPIHALIKSYVEDRRTIIMAVLDSRNNLANQEVFRLAKAADPDGSRTIGIMTKLDALQFGDEPAALKITLNQTERLKHGWYCVRNRSTQEINEGITIQQRHEKEAVFFSSSPWTSLSKKHLGIQNLRESLSRLLSAHISHEFPAIEREIEASYSTAVKALDALGAPHQTSQELTQYLVRLAVDYQSEVSNSLEGRYSEEDMHPSKLRMHTQSASDAFNNFMHTMGNSMRFNSADDDIVAPNPFGTQRAPDKNDIYREILEQWRLFRGPELPGLVNLVVLERLFNQQARPWDDIANGHLASIFAKISGCNHALFDKVCPDAHVCEKIRSRIQPFIAVAYNKAHAELAALLKDERSGHLFTNNHYLADNLQAARADRFLNGLKRIGFKDGQMYPATINFAQMKANVHLSNETSAVYDIHDILKAYYKVSIKRFIDNVGNQIVERTLLGPEGPLAIFTPQYVSGLSDEEKAAIAGEDEVTTETRSELGMQIERLMVARKICRGRGAE